MSRIIFLGVALLTLAACSDKSPPANDTPAPRPVVVKGKPTARVNTAENVILPPRAGELRVEEDFQEEAALAVTVDNYKTELARLEEEINAESAVEPADSP